MAGIPLNIVEWQDCFGNRVGNGQYGDNRPLDATAAASAVVCPTLYHAVRLDGSLDYVGTGDWPTPEAKADWVYDMQAGTYGKAEFINISARAELLGRHPTQRDVLIFPLLRTGVGPAEGQFKLRPDNFWQYLESGDPNVPATARLIARYAERMYADGLEPSLWLDYENVQSVDGAFFFQNGANWPAGALNGLLAHPKARFLVPSWVRQYNETQIYTRGSAGFHAWNLFARNLQARDLRRAVLTPMARSFPRFANFRTAQVINYGFRRVNARNAFVDETGELVSPRLGQPFLSNITTDYSVYSPYNGDVAATPGAATDPNWAQLVTMVNLVRRTLNSGFRTVTQITPPMYRGNAAQDTRRNLLFYAALYQLAAHGASKVLLWSAPIERRPNARDQANQAGTGVYGPSNPALAGIISEWHATAAWYADFADRVKGITVNTAIQRKRDWPIVNPADGTIVTGDYTTTYASIFGASAGTPPGQPAPGNTQP